MKSDSALVSPAGSDADHCFDATGLRVAADRISPAGPTRPSTVTANLDPGHEVIAVMGTNNGGGA